MEVRRLNFTNQISDKIAVDTLDGASTCLQSENINGSPGVKPNYSVEENYSRSHDNEATHSKPFGVVGSPVKLGNEEDSKSDEISPNSRRKLPQVLVSPENVRHAELAGDYHALTDERPSQSGSIMLAQDLTHLEIGALVGPPLLWTDPFEVRS